MVKRIFLIIMLLFVVGVVTSCKDKDDEKKLVYNLGTDPKTWDPGFNTAVDGGHLIANMFEGLYRDTPEGSKPAGIEDVDISVDHKTYTFHLRKDAKWSNGEPVTAYDYQFAWLRVIDPEIIKNF